MEELVRIKTVEELEAEYNKRQTAKKEFAEKKNQEKIEEERRKKMIFFFDWPDDVKLKFAKRLLAAIAICVASIILLENTAFKICASVFAVVYLLFTMISYDKILREKLYRNALLYVNSVTAHSLLNFVPVLAVYDVNVTFQYEDSEEYITSDIQTKLRNEFKEGQCYDCKIIDGDIFSKILVKQ